MNNWSLRPAVPQDAIFAAPLIVEAAVGWHFSFETARQSGAQTFTKHRSAKRKRPLIIRTAWI